MGHNLWLHLGVDENPFATYFDVSRGFLRFDPHCLKRATCLAGIRTPAKQISFLPGSGKQRDPKKSGKKKEGELILGKFIPGIGPY